MNTSFLSKEEIQEIGFLSVGENVFISRKASFYSAEKISIGDNVRIDDFCILSGKIKIKNNIHIAPYSALFGGIKGIVLNDYVNISSKVSIYSLSDDFSGNYMTSPVLPDEYKNVTEEEVILEKHVIIGSGSMVLPGVVLREGTAVGAMSLVKESTERFGIYAGIPAKRIKNRSKRLIKLEKDIENEKSLLMT